MVSPVSSTLDSALSAIHQWARVYLVFDFTSFSLERFRNLTAVTSCLLPCVFAAASRKLSVRTIMLGAGPLLVGAIAACSSSKAKTRGNDDIHATGSRSDGGIDGGRDASLPPIPPLSDGEIPDGGAIRCRQDGQRCTVSVGECAARGAYICLADGGVFCNAGPAGLPSTEVICNHLDEDCDGVALWGIDEDHDRYSIDGDTCGPVDCDDTNPSVHPEAGVGGCIGLDYDCDGIVSVLPLINAQGVSAVGGPSSTNPSVAFSGSSFGVVWYSNRREERQIRFQLLDANGRGASNMIVLSDNPTAVGFPNVVWTGTEFHVSWMEDSLVYLARVSERGRAIGTKYAVTTHTTTANSVSHAWGEGMGGVVWESYQTEEFRSVKRIFFQKFDAQGNSIGAEVVLNTAPVGFPNRPVIALSNTGNAVAWEHSFTLAGANPRKELRLAFFDDAGNVSHENVLRTLPYTGDHWFYNISLVSAGTRWGLSWLEITPENTVLYFGSVSEEGIMTVPSVVRDFGRPGQGVFSAEEHSTIWAGGEFWTGWTERVGTLEEGYRQMYLKRWDRTGTPQGEVVSLLRQPDVPVALKLVPAEEGVGMVWSDNPNSGLSREIYFGLWGCR